MKHNHKTLKAALTPSPFILHLSHDRMATTTDLPFSTLDDANAALDAFRVANCTDPLAEAAIWSNGDLRYLGTFRGGVKFGPFDTRHPMVRVYGDAIRADRSVAVISDAGTVRFGRAA